MNVLAIVRSPLVLDATCNPALITELDEATQDLALAMLRDELRDTKEIAWRLGATEAAVANGIARARERGRRI